MAEVADDRYEVVVIRYGTRRTKRSAVFLNYPVYGTDDGPIGMDYFIWVVRNAHRTILVDTGFSASGGATRQRETLITPPEAWRHLGIDLHSALTVVLTHAHYDHAGNLGELPAAEVVAAQAEVDFWLGPLAGRAQFRHSIDAADLAAVAAARDEGRLRTFVGTTQVAPGVEVIEVGGHTPGQAVVLVQTLVGPVLLASDAVHYDEELTADMPFTHVSNLPDTYAAFDRITEMGEQRIFEHLVPGHDPATLDRFPAFDGLADGLAAIIGRRTP